MSKKSDVGYGKPPKSGQFKKGKSGNPKGRPKGTKNLKTDLEEELQEKILIKEAGAGKSVSKQRALIKSLMAKAVSGDVRAATLVVNMFLKLIPEDVEPNSEEPLSQTDVEILAEFEARILKSGKKKGKKNGQSA